MYMHIITGAWWQPGEVVSMLVAINTVALGQAWFLLGWVIVCEQVNHLGM